MNPIFIIYGLYIGPILLLALAIILIGVSLMRIKRQYGEILHLLLQTERHVRITLEDVFEIKERVVELDQDAGDVKRRLTWSKKREKKDLRQEKGGRK